MKKTIFTLVASSLFALGAFASTDCDKEGTFGEIEKGELQALVAKQKTDKTAVTIVDVNSKESFAKAHIGEAIHYGSSGKTFVQKLPSKKDALIVAYCGGMKCGAWKKAASEACKLGYTNIKHFKPGISGWTSGS